MRDHAVFCFKRGVRQGRLKAPPDHAMAVYHCFSRIVDRRRVILKPEAEFLRDLLNRCEEFCGVQVLAFIILENHFHVLVAVPQRPNILPDDATLLQRIAKLSGSRAASNVRQQLDQLRRSGDHEAAEALRQRFFRRMWDVSEFMKAFKQGFSQWFNRRHQRTGTLWEGRFGSVLVEGMGLAAASIAAYIDLNSVRAKIVDDPAKYRWSSYAEAMAGSPKALKALRILMAAARRENVESMTNKQALRDYRIWLSQKGEERDGLDQSGKPLRKGLSREAIAAVLAAKGKVSLPEYLQRRVRYFTAGAILGSKEFVNGIYLAHRSRFGPRRKDGARRMRGVASTELHVLRALRKDLFG